MKPSTKVLQLAIEAVEDNAQRLLEDAKYLFDMERYPTAFSLTVLAQEEVAKAFLLRLVEDRALPWLPEVRRTMAKHECKHLLAIVLEWIPQMDFGTMDSKNEERSARHQLKMDWYERLRQRHVSGDWSEHPEDPEPADPKVDFPKEVADAINIFRHEEVERYRPLGYPWKDEEWASGHARKIADGWLDKQKQSGFYVEISKTGQIGQHPGLVSREMSKREIEKTEQLHEMRDRASDEYTKLTTLLPLIFANLSSQP